MARGFVRRLALWAIFAMALVAVGSIMISVLAGGRLVQSSLIAELNALTGRQVQADDRVRVSIFPDLTAELSNVVIRDWMAVGDEPPLMTAETMTLTLSARDALDGRAVIEAIDLKSPRLIVPMRDGSPEFAAGGRIDAAFRNAIRMRNANPDEVRFAPSRQNGIATIVIRDGEIGFSNDPTAAITGIDARLRWTLSSDALAASGQAVWQGVPLEFEGRISDLIHLVAGRSVEAAIRISSNPVQLSYSGLLTRQPSLFLDGSFSMAFDTLERLEDWSGMRAPLGGLESQIALSGPLKGEASRWTVTDATLRLDETNGRGSLTLSNLGNTATLVGTLDLDALDLVDLSALVLPGDIPQLEDEADGLEGDAEGERDINLALDLRISAGTARFGTIVFNDVAATARRHGDGASLDVNDADALGGMVQLAIRTEIEEGARVAEVRVLGEDIDMAQLRALNPDLALVPTGTGNISLIARGPLLPWPDAARSLDGSVAVRISNGSWSRIDGNALIDNLRKGGFFSLFANGDGAVSAPLAFSALEGKTILRGGDLMIERLNVTSPTSTLALSGVASVVNQSLALNGQLTLADNHPRHLAAADNATTPPTNSNQLGFFLGGDALRAFVATNR